MQVDLKLLAGFKHHGNVEEGVGVNQKSLRFWELMLYVGVVLNLGGGFRAARLIPELLMEMPFLVSTS